MRIMKKKRRKAILSTTWARRFQPVMIFRVGAGGPGSGSDSSQGGITWAGTWPANVQQAEVG